MDQFNGIQFFLLFITIYPPIAVSLYLAVRLTLKFSFYRSINNDLPHIRKVVISHWQSQFQDIPNLLDNVPVEHLRVIGASSQDEDRRFSLFTILFYLFSALLLIEGLAGQSIGIELLKSKESYFLVPSLTLIAQLIALAWIVFSNYYQYDFYKTIDHLHVQANRVD